MELALFAISALLSTVSAVTVVSLYVWPWLRTARPNQALSILVAPHLFLRFIGLSLLVPGVVAAALPAAVDLRRDAPGSLEWSRECP